MGENDRTWSTGRMSVVAVAVAVGLGAAWWILRMLRAAARRVSGDSMRPTLSDGDLVLTLPAWSREVRTGRVVVVRDPRHPGHHTIKRIVAAPGEWASLPDGPGRVPRHRVAVEGDDASASTDSRVFGPVPVDLVERHVVARLWPPRVLW